MIIVTVTEIQNNFGKYLMFAMEGQEVVIFKNGSEVARLVSKNGKLTMLTDSLIGVLKNDTGLDAKAITSERMKKFEVAGCN